MKPIKILIVNTDEGDFNRIKDLFLKIPDNNRYRITWCNSYEAAINAMLKQYYQVYLVDYRLEKYTGIDLLNEAIKSNCNDPIIILAAEGDLKIDEEALKSGAADYLVKDGLEPFALERSVRYALRHTKALKALKESEKKFRIIFERYKDPILITDFTGLIFDINKAAKQFFGLQDRDILNADIRKIYKNPQDRERLLEMIQEKGTVNDFETELIDAEGQTRLCIISCFLQISQHGQTEIYHTIIDELPYQPNLDAEAFADEKLYDTGKDTKRFANQIRNPLSNIHLAVDELTVYMDNPDDNLKLYLDIIRNDCKRINQLIIDLLAV